MIMINQLEGKKLVICIENKFAKGDDFNRYELQRAIQLIKTGRVRRLISRDVERLWRGTEVFNKIINEIK